MPPHRQFSSDIEPGLGPETAVEEGEGKDQDLLLLLPLPLQVGLEDGFDRSD